MNKTENNTTGGFYDAQSVISTKDAEIAALKAERDAWIAEAKLDLEVIQELRVDLAAITAERDEAMAASRYQTDMCGQALTDLKKMTAERDAALASEAVYRQLCDDAKPIVESNIALSAERDALRKDAERYRHVRDGGNSDYRICQYLVAAHGFVQLRCDPAYADKLIDAAMTKEPK